MVWTENGAVISARDLKGLVRMTQTPESERIDAVMLREHIVPGPAVRVPRAPAPAQADQLWRPSLRGSRAPRPTGPGFGGVDRDRETRVGGKLHALVREGQLAHDRVMELLDAGVVEADVVGGPAGSELLALR